MAFDKFFYNNSPELIQETWQKGTMRQKAKWEHGCAVCKFRGERKTDFDVEKFNYECGHKPKKRPGPAGFCRSWQWVNDIIGG